MSKHGFAIVSLLAITAALLAQPPMGGGSPTLPPPGAGSDGRATLRPALDPSDRLDALLLKWEQNTAGVESILVPKLVRTNKDKLGSRTYEGEARYLKPGYAALRLIQQQNPGIYELFVCTNQAVYEYRPQSRKLVIHELNPAKTGDFNNNLLRFLFGMTAADAKRRFELTLAKDVSPENPHYIYIDIKPRFTEEQREFQQAQMVFFANSMLPRRVWFRKPNDEEELWDLPNFDRETKLKPTDFTAPPPPKDWTTVKEPWVDSPTPGTQPRVVRPASK